jgi:hypothetical protein
VCVWAPAKARGLRIKERGSRFATSCGQGLSLAFISSAIHMKVNAISPSVSTPGSPESVSGTWPPERRIRAQVMESMEAPIREEVVESEGGCARDGRDLGLLEDEGGAGVRQLDPDTRGLREWFGRGARVVKS